MIYLVGYLLVSWYILYALNAFLCGYKELPEVREALDHPDLYKVIVLLALLWPLTMAFMFVSFFARNSK